MDDVPHHRVRDLDRRPDQHHLEHHINVEHDFDLEHDIQHEHIFDSADG